MPQDNKNLFNLIRYDLPSHTRPDFLTLLLEEGYPTFAYTAVNAVADLTGIPIETVYGRLIEIACELGLMPKDRKCVFLLLEEYHFYRQPCKEEDTSAFPFLERMTEYFLDADCALTMRRAGGRIYVIIPQNGAVAAKLKERESAMTGVFCDWSNFGISGVWIHWQDGENHSPVKRRKVKRRQKTRSHSFTENNYFKPFQPNPLANNIGDCVIRAMSGVFDTSWENVVKALSDCDLLYNAALNSLNVFVDFLIKRGLERHRPLGEGKNMPTGIEFCRQATAMYHKGERLFVYVGRTHVAAVLPTECSDGTMRYKAHDSWNCTFRKFGEYWIRRDETLTGEQAEDKAEHETENKAEDKAEEENAQLRKPIEAFAPSDKICHPSYGEGVITAVTGSAESPILNVSFETAGMKKLSALWAKEHCTLL